MFTIVNYLAACSYVLSTDAASVFVTGKDSHSSLIGSFLSFSIRAVNSANCAVVG